MGKEDDRLAPWGLNPERSLFRCKLALSFREGIIISSQKKSKKDYLTTMQYHPKSCFEFPIISFLLIFLWLHQTYAIHLQTWPLKRIDGKDHQLIHVSPQQRCAQTRWWESVPQIFRFVKRTYLLYVLDSPPVSSSG